MDVINDALQYWCAVQRSSVHYSLKGQSILTEMYSAIEADVPVPSDPSTHTDFDLLRLLWSADNVS